ncbi:MAG: dienelactone hydrolase [Planctomycetota bacterium]
MNRFVIALTTVIASGFSIGAADYDPLRVDDAENEIVELDCKDSARNRIIPLKVYLPKTDSADPSPVLLFSHGLGGSRDGCSYLGQHWSKRGYVAVFLQHAGSDAEVWRSVNLRQRMSALKQAANGRNALARFQDVPAVIDALETWNPSDSHPLSGRMDLERIGMSGHSFGAVTTSAVSGQSYPGQGKRFTEERIDAALLFSPNRPNLVEPAVAFGKVTIPWMLMTGTKDTSPINDTTVEDRLSVYPALPSTIHRYEVVLDQAEHSAFSDERRRFGQAKRNENHHRVILALSTAFWDSHLRNDSAAQKWLQAEGAKRVLEKADRWQLGMPREAVDQTDASEAKAPS